MGRQKWNRNFNGILLFSVITLTAASLFDGNTAWGVQSPQKTGSKSSVIRESGNSFVVRAVKGAGNSAKKTSGWKGFTDKYGSGWDVKWNDLTGLPSRINGNRIPTGLKADSSDKLVETWAREFVGRNKGVFGVETEQLRLVEVSRAGGRTYVTFQQTQDDIAIYGSCLKMNFDKNGDLVGISSGCYPDVAYNPETKFSLEKATETAAAGICGDKSKAGKSKFALLESEKTIFPLLRDPRHGFRLCYLLKIHTAEPLGDWIVVMDVLNGTEYVRYNNYRFGTISGKVTGDILPAHYDDTPTTVNFEDQEIHAFGDAPVYSWDMAVDPGWTKEGSWTWGVPNGVGGDVGDSAPTSGYTGTHVYAYGLDGGYDNDIAETRHLTTNAFDCSSLMGTHLSFWRWLGVEGGFYDSVSIDVSSDGVNWTPVWRNPSSLDVFCYGWQRVVYDISSVADGQADVYVRWGVGPTNASYSFCGWHIDDVEIYANGGTVLVSSDGDYGVSYTGAGNETVYAEMSSRYRDVYYEDGRRFFHEQTVASGVHNWAWVIPDLSTVQSWELGSDPGWTVEGDWAYGVPGGNDGDPSGGYTGSTVYGYNLAGAYGNDMGSTQYLTTTAINCSSYVGTHLRFWRWLGVEYYDWATVEVSNNGADWALVYVNLGFPADLDTEWRQVVYDISEVADGRSTVYIRWGMGPTTPAVTYCGWNVDDVEILADISGSNVRPGVYGYDEVNVFHHMNVARNSIKEIEPGFTGMDYKVPAVVRYGIDYANAFSDGEGIYFGEGDGVWCRNLALFADVVYHEFNHGITNKIYPEGALPYVGESGAMDEAWSDYFACNVTDEPLIGEGDLIIGEPYMRTLDNDLRMPDDWAGEVHDDGRIIGGAFWDLRTLLGSYTASNLIHFARYNFAETFMDYYEDVLLTDDDNGDLYDGTPNMTTIAKAFGKHGIGGLETVGLGWDLASEATPNGKLDAGERGDLALTVKSYFVADNVCADLASSNPFVVINDGSSVLGDIGYGDVGVNASDPMTISIDANCPDDEVMELSLSLTADDGYAYTQAIPLVNAPDQIVYDGGSADRYLGYGMPGGGFAVRFTPPFYPITIVGVRLWPSAGSPGMEVDLCAWDDDGVDGFPGKELMAPKPVVFSNGDCWEEFSLTHQLFEPVYSWNMDTDPGWTTQGYWDYGVPTGIGGEEGGSPDPTSGATGADVYGHNLNGDYPDDMATTEYLTTTAIDCSGLTGVHLQFERWLGVESGDYDHACIEASNNGTDWELVWENDAQVDDSHWRTVTYDVSSIADGRSTVYIRWGIGVTDGSIRYCSWNIDDVRIVVPGAAREGFTVTSGDIYLGWIEKEQVYFNGVTIKNPDGRSLVYDIYAGDSWIDMGDAGFPVDLLIRARYLLPETVRTGIENEYWESMK